MKTGPQGLLTAKQYGGVLTSVSCWLIGLIKWLQFTYVQLIVNKSFPDKFRMRNQLHGILIHQFSTRVKL